MWKIKKTTALLLLAVLLTGCSGQEQEKREVLLYEGEETKQSESEIKTTKVEKGDYVEQMIVNASLNYLEQVSVFVDVENATLKDLKVSVGDKVKKGDVIATYKVHQSKSSLEKERLEIENERSSYNAELKRQQNEIEELNRQIKNAENNEQKKVLQEQLRQANQALSQFKQTESSILEKEKSYRKTIAEGKKTKLISPYSGVVSKVMSEEEGGFELGSEVVTLRTEKDFLIAAEDTESAMRYNMKVTVMLGGDRNDIRNEMSGTVISASNLTSSNSDSDEGDSGSQVYIRLSKKDREKYNFEKNNIYVKYEKMRVKDCLMVDKEAINSEINGADETYYVWLVENGKLYKRYIQKAFEQEAAQTTTNGMFGAEAAAPEEAASEDGKVWILQGVEEGQELALEV